MILIPASLGGRHETSTYCNICGSMKYQSGGVKDLFFGDCVGLFPHLASFDTRAFSKENLGRLLES